jgi:hypothetical protein
MWIKFFVLQLCFTFFTLGIGFIVADKLISLQKIDKVFWIDRLCIATFSVIFIFALAGILIVITPSGFRGFFGKAFVFIIAFLSVYFFITKKLYKSLFEASRVEKIFFIGFIVMTGVSLAITFVPVKLPAQLVDGPYVVKQEYLGVKIQYLTGNLPTDNSLPHVVSEYLLRDISFKSDRPVMPGQEVSNRPILVPLFLVPIRAAFSLPSNLPNGLPKFSYVGASWPDFSVLMQDDYAYMFSLSIGIVLNALIFLAIAAYAVREPTISELIAVSVVALMISSPYFIFQTVFTWPKELAAFFVLYSILLYHKLKAPILAGGFLALAYLSHPYAVVFIIGFVLHSAFMCLSKMDRFQNNIDQKSIVLYGSDELRSYCTSNIKKLISFLMIFVLLVTPWFVWTKLILKIPSDLVSQNFIQGGQSLMNFLWIRPVNFLNTILPLHLLHYPFDLFSVVLGSTITIPGATGTLIFIFSSIYFYENMQEKGRIFLIYIPTCLLILIFSNQAVPALHGLQGPIGLLLLVGVLQMKKILNSTQFYLFTTLQIIVNILLLSIYLFRLT